MCGLTQENVYLDLPTEGKRREVERRGGKLTKGRVEEKVRRGG